MSTRAAIVIGVDHTGDLPPLRAAASGAQEFADWANTQDYAVTLLTDKNNGSVGVTAIKLAIRQIVDARTYSQLLVYFAGHGILRAAETELWLLSGAPGEPNEAVNLSASCLLARWVGINHVVFISDTCRSIPTTVRLNQVVGSVIFPNEAHGPKRPSVDLFYAALPGDPAYEIPIGPAAEAARQHHGIFSRMLLQGLTGSVPTVWEKWTEDDQERLVIPSWTLKPYLEQQVPIALSGPA